MQENKTRIRAFFARFHRNLDLHDDVDIFASGFVNSLMAMQLVLFVEKEFEIPIENDDLDLDNFRSVNAIADLIERKQGAQVPA
jgi:acyl carrier protein